LLKKASLVFEFSSNNLPQIKSFDVSSNLQRVEVERPPVVRWDIVLRDRS